MSSSSMNSRGISGCLDTYATSATIATRLTIATPPHHQRARYSSPGNPAAKNRPTGRSEKRRPPVSLARAATTSRDSDATSAGSGALPRITDRWVAARWYNNTSSSASAGLSRRVRVSVRNRAHSPRRSATYASRSTGGAYRGRVNPERLVNGEGVEVDLRYARLGSRGLALLIDILSQIALFIGLFVIIGPLTTLLPEGEADDAFFAAATVAVIVVVLVVYPTTIETLTNGRSLGKLAVGLRVVRADGGPIRLRHALTRALVGVTLEWPGLMLPFVTWVV